MNVGIIEAIIRLKDEFSAGVRKAQESFRGLKTSIGTVSTAMKGMASAFAGLAVLTAVKQFADLTGKLTDLSAKTGIGTTELQKLKFMAEQSGGSLDKVTTAVAMMGRNLIRGQEGAVNAVKALGLNFAEVRAMQPDQAFALIADRVAGIQSPMERAAIATEIFGRAGADLLPMFTGNLKAMGDEAERAGLVLDEATVKAGDEFGDALGKLMTAGMALIGNVLSPLLPHLTLLIEFFSKVAQVVGTVLTAAFQKAQEVGQKVIEWISGMLGKFLEFAQKIPGVSKVVDRLKQEHEDLGKLTQWLGDQYQDLKPKTDTAKSGMEGLRFEIGMTADASERQAKALSKSASEMKDKADVTRQLVDVSRLVPTYLLGIAGSSRTLGQQIQVDTKHVLAYHEALKKVAYVNGIPGGAQIGQNVGMPQIPDPPKLTGWQQWRNELGNIAVALQDVASRTRGLFAETVSHIASAIRSWDIYKQAVTGAQKTIAIAQGVWQTWQASGAQSRTSAILGGAASGASTGAAIGSVIPGLGTAAGFVIGGAAGAITGWIRSMNNGRQAVEDFAKSFGGFDALRTKLNELGDEGERLWISLTQGVGKGNVQQAQAAIDAVTEALQRQAFAQQDNIAKAEQAATALQTSQQAAFDKVTGQLASLDAEYNRLWESIKDEAPEEVMGVVEQQTRARMEAIAKERAQTQSEIERLTEAMGGSFERVAEAAEDAVDRIVEAFEGMNLPGLTHPGRYTVEPDVPGFSGGTGGRYVDFGRGTLAMLHGRERIMTEAESRSGGGTVTVRVPVHLDGRQITEVVVPNIPAALKRHGLVR